MPPKILAPTGRNPFWDHFVDVSQMIPAYPSGTPATLNNQARELESCIAKNVATQGDALGYGVEAPLARKNPRTYHYPDVRKMLNVQQCFSRTNGAKLASPGQRPGNPPHTLSSPERAELLEA